MRLHPIVIAVLLLLSLSFPSSSRADLTIVADLDGNFSNGPDSITAEAGDTVSVDIWIVGSDALHSFGITLSDTANSGTWISSGVGQSYFTPDGWSDAPIQLMGTDSSSVMIQSTDFSLTNPIHTPTKIAELKFQVLPMDSCVSITVDSANSGWWNTGQGEEGFSASPGALVCVDTFISQEMRSQQADESTPIPVLYESYSHAVTMPGAALAIYRLIENEVPEELRKGRKNLLVMAIRSTLRDYSSLRTFIRGFPETTRPFRSRLIASYLMEREGEVTEEEYRDLEEIMLRDLSDHIGGPEGIPVAEAFAAVLRKFHRDLGYVSRQPDSVFQALSEILCRTTNQREYGCIASALYDQGAPQLRRLFLDEMTGNGCTTSGPEMHSRVMLRHLLIADTAAQDLVSILQEPRNDRTFGFALLDASYNEGLRSNLGLHREVLDSFGERFGHLTGQEMVFLQSAQFLANYIEAFWEEISQEIKLNPQAFQDHAGLIAKYSNRVDVLEFVARYGRQLGEPYLNAFAKEILVGGGRDEASRFLQSVGAEKLRKDVRRRLESRAAPIGKAKTRNGRSNADGVNESTSTNERGGGSHEY